MREAMFYEKIDGRTICHLCPNNCIIKLNEQGICGTRAHIDEKLYAMNYGKITAIQIDPIEKKPLANWHPGTMILSIGSYGCNLKCPFCQNFELVQSLNTGVKLTPEAVVAQAISHNLEAIAYTYNEPTVFYEMVYDTAKIAKERGLHNVLVTNGYINREPLEKLMPYIDALNVDIKSYDDRKLLDLCGGRLEPVINTILYAKSTAHVEVTMLMVPTLYDDLEEIDKFGRWLSLTIGDVPVHLSRYFPRYKHDEPATDIEFMLDVREKMQQYFTHVYLGNVGVQ